MIPAGSLRLPASPLGRAALLGACLLAAASLALSSGGLAPIAARAGLAAGGIVAVAVLVRRREGTSLPSTRLSVVEQARLGGGAGVAVVEAGERRLLVGFGRDGVRLVADLGPRGGSLP